MTAAPPAETDAAVTVLPLTESQKGLLVVDGRVTSPEIYNQIGRFNVDPALEPAAIRDALVMLVTIQPGLRQAFQTVPQLAARLLEPPSAADFPLETVVAPADRYEQVLADLVLRVGRPPFDLHTGPAYRFGYVRADDGSDAAILLVMHHLVGDGVSVQPIVRDLQRALSGELDAEQARILRGNREKALLKELNAQIRTSSSPQTAERTASWADRLREVPPTVLFPRPNRPVETAFNGRRVEWHMSLHETERFGEACKRLGVSPFVMFTALYGAVVARHAGTGTVLIGSPFMARRTVGAFDLCGFFVNTLPVAVTPDWSASFDAHVAHVREQIDYCRANVDVAFNQLVAQVKPDRSSNRNPLFSCMLAMQDTFDARESGAVRSMSEPANNTAKFDLWLGVTPIDGRWLLEFEYDVELIPSLFADDLMASLRTLTTEALAGGDRELRAYFRDASLVQSLRTDGFAALPEAGTLIEWVARTAAAAPDAVAIEDPKRQLTYAELMAETRQVAAGLVAAGVAPGDVVGLNLDTLSDTTVAILAALACGAAYLPLDPTLPAERLAYMIEKSGCRLAIAASPGQDLVATRTLSELAAGGDGEDLPDPDPDRPVYIMFTSGSTGRPKGVRMGHRPLLNLTAWQVAALDMTAHTRFMQYAPLGFDVSFQEMLPTLVAGGTVVSREPADRRDFPSLARRIADSGVTHVYLPVAALRPLVQAARALKITFPYVRRLCVSGEQLLVDEEIRSFLAEHPHCRLVNLYGPTETHAVTTYVLSGQDPQWPAHVPIGRPLAGVRAYVVDVCGRLAPTGTPGELYLGGVCPADGYVNDPEKTAAGFVADRFVDGEPGIMYRTGDLVMWDEDGQLVFLGRNDNQVKIRGYRIELGEIEAAAQAAPGVRQAVALVRGDAATRELVLFLIPEPATVPDPDLVLRRMGELLPSYMLPAHTFTVGEVPTSSTGKTDRDALLATAERLIAQARGTAGPQPGYRDDLERDIAGIWAGILEAEQVPADRSVLDLGAHSLTVFAALAEIQQRYDVVVPLIDFFREPYVATCANVVRDELAEDAA